MTEHTPPVEPARSARSLLAPFALGFLAAVFASTAGYAAAMGRLWRLGFSGVVMATMGTPTVTLAALDWSELTLIALSAISGAAAVLVAARRYFR